MFSTATTTKILACRHGADDCSILKTCFWDWRRDSNIFHTIRISTMKIAMKQYLEVKIQKCRDDENDSAEIYTMSACYIHFVIANVELMILMLKILHVEHQINILYFIFCYCLLLSLVNVWHLQHICACHRHQVCNNWKQDSGVWTLHVENEIQKRSCDANDAAIIYNISACCRHHICMIVPAEDTILKLKIQYRWLITVDPIGVIRCQNGGHHWIPRVSKPPCTNFQLLNALS